MHNASSGWQIVIRYKNGVTNPPEKGDKVERLQNNVNIVDKKSKKIELSTSQYLFTVI